MLMFLSALHDLLPGARIFTYITFRTIAAILTSVLIAFLFFPSFIALLKARQEKGQPIRADGPETHFKKAGTPTMGGLIIIGSGTVSTLLWGNLENIYVWMGLFILLSFGAIGFYDDYLKVTKQSDKGFSGKARLCAEALLAMGASLIIMHYGSSGMMIPFFKNYFIDLGWFYIIFASFVIVGSGNAVNFTDGLDGLATVPIIVSISSFALIAYLCGNMLFADYLQISYVPGAGELTVLAGALIGAAFVFLWFNAPPAKIFMGDTGSLALGGVIGYMAVITKHEIVLIVIGGLFVIEALSVILQVASYKLRGKRIFLMAPIHHHFEKKGWSESQIVIRFWIISILLALVGLSSLKLR